LAALVKSQALIRITEGKGAFHLTYFAVDLSQPNITTTREEALAWALEVSQRESEGQARRVIGLFAQESHDVRCPEGFVDLPLDAWSCKLTKQPCRLQAFVPMNDRAAFSAGCHAASEKQEQIFSTIRAGKYTGFHHVPGRYLCARCEDIRNGANAYCYHFHWEMARLDAALGIDNDALDRQINAKQLARPYVFTRLCARCCLEMARILSPEKAVGLELLEFDIFPR
jgi:hypothetical protein